MADYTWPTSSLFQPSRFQMRVEATNRAFRSPYSQQVQVVDLMADFLVVSMVLPGDVASNDIAGGQMEAFFDRLKGQANRIILWNLQRPAPLGTMRGSPTLSASAAQFANTLSIQTTAGATLLRGDMIGVGSQLFRVMADATANGSGLLSVEVAPRVRAAISSGTAVVWAAPTAPFRVSSSKGLGVDWTPDSFTPPSLDLQEDF